MQSAVAFVRNLFSGLFSENQAVRTSFKRDRADDDFSSEDDFPTKRFKELRRTSFPDAMASNDWKTEENSKKKVRYVPIQIESGHPSTSTPNESRGGSRMRTVPIQFVSKENGPSTPARKPRMHTPLQPIYHEVIADDDDEDNEITLVETKPEKTKKNRKKIYINLDDYENEPEEDDVIFVKKVTTPPPEKPYKYFVSKTDYDVLDNQQPLYLRLKNRSTDRSCSPKTYSKFKAPPGITKPYKKPPVPVARWMQSQKPSNLSQSRNRYQNFNGNSRSTLSEVFNLDEKRNYQELIKQVAGAVKPAMKSKPIDIINLAEDVAAFRLTQRSQKSALNELKFLEKDLQAEKENESLKEYDPITVASINSSDSEVEVVPSESSSSVRIDPINSLKDSFQDHPITNSDWLPKFKYKYKKKEQESKEKLKDVELESNIISKVLSEQKEAYLAHRLKTELSIPENLIEEPQATVELPKLSPEQEKLISRALGPGPPNQLLVEKFNLRIHRRDLQTLAGLNWLNDEVINFYMNLLMQRSEERKDLPKVYATNTFFYPKLMQSGQAGLRRWTRKVDIFAHDLMVVPVHLGVHWCLSLVDFREKKISYLDSMGSRNQPCLEALKQYLKDEHQDKKGQPFDDSGWKAECLKDIPQQMNGSDCGMFACTFAEFSARNAPYSFTQSHMPYLRRKAALEILQGRLLL